MSWFINAKYRERDLLNAYIGIWALGAQTQQVKLEGKKFELDSSSIRIACIACSGLDPSLLFKCNDEETKDRILAYEDKDEDKEDGNLYPFTIILTNKNRKLAVLMIRTIFIVHSRHNGYSIQLRCLSFISIFFFFLKDNKAYVNLGYVNNIFNMKFRTSTQPPLSTQPTYISLIISQQF